MKQLRDSFVADGPRHAICQLKSCQLLHTVQNIAFEKASNSRMTLKVTQGYRNCDESIGHTFLPISGR